MSSKLDYRAMGAARAQMFDYHDYDHATPSDETLVAADLLEEHGYLDQAKLLRECPTFQLNRAFRVHGAGSNAVFVPRTINVEWHMGQREIPNAIHEFDEPVNVEPILMATLQIECQVKYWNHNSKEEKDDQTYSETHSGFGATAQNGKQGRCGPGR